MPPKHKPYLPTYANYIVGVDPGVSTGIAVLGWDGDEPPNIENITYTLRQFTYGNSGSTTDDKYDNEIEMIQGIAEYILTTAWSIDDYLNPQIWLAMESFTLRQTNSSPEYLSPVRVASGIIAAILGRIDPAHYEYPFPTINLTYQSPADAKNICTNERLEKWGFQITKNDMRHSLDALRHAVTCARKLNLPTGKQQNLFTLL